jgi:hypothetical protein
MTPSTTSTPSPTPEEAFRATLAQTRASLAAAKALSAEIAKQLSRVEAVADFLRAKREAKIAAYVRKHTENPTPTPPQPNADAA